MKQFTRTGGEQNAIDLSGVYSISGRPVSAAWIVFGKHSYYARHLQVGSWMVGEKVVVGRYCSIADQVTILAGGNRHTDCAANYPVDVLAPAHRPRGNGTRPSTAASPAILKTLRIIQVCLPLLVAGRSYLLSRATVIGNDVWIGVGAMILGGVHVGDGAVVGAGAVVSRDVSPYAVVVGNPARVVRSRFAPDIIERMLRIKWWDWPDADVAANLDWFYKPIGQFVDRFDRAGRRRPSTRPLLAP